jgi:hypothetical protein
VYGETREQSKQWMHARSPNKPKKFKQTLSARKLMACFLGQDEKGMPMVKFMQQGTTVTCQMYCETLKKLRKAIQKKRRGMVTYGVVLLYDNALPHTAARTRVLQEHLNWELFDHPHSPHTSPNICHLFTLTYLKNWLRSQRFSNNEEPMEGVRTWLTS